MNVLMILNHAPDYREAFLRELGTHKSIDLTVVAQPCEPDALTPPECRRAYEYIEIKPVRFFGLSWQPGLGSILRGRRWDVVCVSANLRQLSRIFLFLTNRSYRDKWVWWGLIFGQARSPVLEAARKQLLKRAAGCLVHSKAVSSRLHREYGIQALSYNNTEVSRHEFRPGSFAKRKDEIRMLFVGTYKPRKKLERLVEIARRRPDVKIRIVGPGMERLQVDKELRDTNAVQVFGRKTGADLNGDFDWADIVVSPGNAGLLSMNAARHGKGIVIDNDSYHGPEVYLAQEAQQPFISFASASDVDRFIDSVHENPSTLETWGQALQEKARREYTIEHMAAVHVRAFEAVSSGRSIPG
ncbi:MAG: glycosyltransferase [Spirochaetales bacterium]